MDPKYIKAMDIARKTKEQLQAINETQDTTDTEELILEAYKTIERLIESLDEAEKDINYLTGERKEGVLVYNNDTERFYILFTDSNDRELSCGNTLELHYQNKWHIGRVEHTRRGEEEGYYFYSDLHKPFLKAGMRVRKRL